MISLQTITHDPSHYHTGFILGGCREYLMQMPEQISW